MAALPKALTRRISRTRTLCLPSFDNCFLARGPSADRDYTIRRSERILVDTNVSWRTSVVAPHMSAFGGRADMAFCRISLSPSLLGVKRTWLIAAHMSAVDPKRT